MSAVLAITILFAFYAIGEFISRKSRGLISGLLVVALLIIAWFLVGLPEDLISASCLTPVGSAMIGLVVVGMGTMFDFAEVKRQWKTILITAIGVFAATGLLIAIGIPLLGLDYTLAGAPVFAGASTAAMIMMEAFNAAGKTSYTLYVTMVLVFQVVVGLPVSSFFIKRAASSLKNNPEELKNYLIAGPESVSTQKLLLPKAFYSPAATMTKLGLIIIVSQLISSLINNVVNAYIIGLVLGFVLTAVGVFERNALEKTGFYGFITLTIIFALLSSLSQITFDSIKATALPLFALLVIGAAFACVVGFFLGKLFKINPNLAICMCLSCMLGFPTTMIVAQEGARGCSDNEEEYMALNNYLTPKMVLAGFVAGTISTIIAGIVVNFVK